MTPTTTSISVSENPRYFACLARCIALSVLIDCLPDRRHRRLVHATAHAPVGVIPAGESAGVFLIRVETRPDALLAHDANAGVAVEGVSDRIALVAVVVNTPLRVLGGERDLIASGESRHRRILHRVFDVVVCPEPPNRTH